MAKETFGSELLAEVAAELQTKTLMEVCEERGMVPAYQRLRIALITAKLPHKGRTRGGAGKRPLADEYAGLRAEGKTLNQIARQFGVTRQAIHNSLLMREAREERWAVMTTKKKGQRA